MTEVETIRYLHNEVVGTQKDEQFYNYPCDNKETFYNLMMGMASRINNKHDKGLNISCHVNLKEMETLEFRIFTNSPIMAIFKLYFKHNGILTTTKVVRMGELYDLK